MICMVTNESTPANILGTGRSVPVVEAEVSEVSESYPKVSTNSRGARAAIDSSSMKERKYSIKLSSMYFEDSFPAVVLSAVIFKFFGGKRSRRERDDEGEA